MPEPDGPLGYNREQHQNADNLMSRVTRLRFRVHRTQVQADHNANASDDGRKALIEPVPSHAPWRDAQEDDPVGIRRMSAPQRHKAWMILGQLLSLEISPFIPEPTEVVYGVGRAPVTPVARTMSIVNEPS